MDKKNIWDAINDADKDGIAIEALHQVELEILNGEISPEEMASVKADEGFTEMAYKDDDGYWRVTGSSIKYDDHEALVRAYPDIC